MNTKEIIICETCNGTGFINGKLVCQNCFGFGKILKTTIIRFKPFKEKLKSQEPTKQELLIQKIVKIYSGKAKGTIILKQDIYALCNEIGIDDSILRKEYFKNKLEQIGIVENPENNRKYIIF